jgi:hypothetical protein
MTVTDARPAISTTLFLHLDEDTATVELHRQETSGRLVLNIREANGREGTTLHLFIDEDTRAAFLEALQTDV